MLELNSISSVLSVSISVSVYLISTSNIEYLTKTHRNRKQQTTKCVEKFSVEAIYTESRQ